VLLLNDNFVQYRFLQEPKSSQNDERNEKKNDLHLIPSHVHQTDDDHIHRKMVLISNQRR
jgi:hypothetical protein